MGRPLWKGSISFGLVNIPVELFVGARDHTPRFRLLHRTDLSPISLERVCQTDGKALAWADLVAGCVPRRLRAGVDEGHQGQGGGQKDAGGVGKADAADKSGRSHGAAEGEPGRRVYISRLSASGTPGSSTGGLTGGGSMSGRRRARARFGLSGGTTGGGNGGWCCGIGSAGGGTGISSGMSRLLSSPEGSKTAAKVRMGRKAHPRRPWIPGFGYSRRPSYHM
jgi:hypothetical protein